MLSNDVAVDVISFLDRIDLDTAEITSRGFNRIVHVYFEDFPRRNITRFILCSGEIIAFHSGKHSLVAQNYVQYQILPLAQIQCKILENGDQIATILPNLEDNLRRLTVREVHFECPLDEVLFNALLPHVARFRYVLLASPKLAALYMTLKDLVKQRLRFDFQRVRLLCSDAVLACRPCRKGIRGAVLLPCTTYLGSLRLRPRRPLGLFQRSAFCFPAVHPCMRAPLRRQHLHRKRRVLHQTVTLAQRRRPKKGAHA